MTTGGRGHPCDACVGEPKPGNRQCRGCWSTLCRDCRCRSAQCARAQDRRRAARANPDAPKTRSRSSTPPRGAARRAPGAPKSGNWGGDKRPRDTRRTGDTPPATRARGSPQQRRRQQQEERPPAAKRVRDDAERQERRVHPRRARGAPSPAASGGDQHAADPTGVPYVTDWEEKHPDDPAGNHLHLTGYPPNMDDCSHLALVWGLPGLRGAQVRRSEAKHEFANARMNAYLFFGTPEQASQAASTIRDPSTLDGARIRMAFPHLRVQQTRADDLIRPDYVLPDNRTHPDDGLPCPGWPRGATWVAHVGQPVQGPLGGFLSPADGHYRDVVEVTARTGHYGPVWHRLGVPANLARILSEERQARALLFKGRTSVETIA